MLHLITMGWTLAKLPPLLTEDVSMCPPVWLRGRGCIRKQCLRRGKGWVPASGGVPHVGMASLPSTW